MEDEIGDIPETLPTNLEQFSNEHLDLIEQIMSMEELIGLYIDSGYINHARAILERYKNHPLTIDEGMADYISYACVLAANEMERGMPLSEIAKLPEFTINQLYTTGDEKIREAIEYFGIDIGSLNKLI